MSYKTLTRIAFVFAPTLTFGQNLFTGRVIDSDTKKPIKEAVVIVDGTNVQTITNFLGYFQVNADSTNQLIIKSDGYEIGLIKVPNVSRFQVQLIKDITPGFGNGINEFYKFMSENLIYPDKARNKDA